AIALFIVAAYLATGEPALLLAKSSGYATPIFPPAGIAIGFCFISGFEILPAVFIGAFLLNFWIGFSKTFHFGTLEIASGLLLAIASTLQAAMGGWALRRLAGFPAPLDRVVDLARFLFVSPAFCLVSSSLSTLSLYWLGAIPASEVLTGWSAWWLGDTLGVVTVFPLVMVLFGEPRPIWKKRALTVALPMMVAFAMFILVFLQTSRWEKGEALAAFRHESQKAEESIDNNLQARASLFEAIGAMMAAREKVSGEEFSRFSRDMLARYPMIRNLGFVSLKSGHALLYSAGEPGFHPDSPEWKSTLAKAAAGGGLVSSAPFRDGRLFAGLKVDGRGIIVATLGMRPFIHDAMSPAIHGRLLDLESGMTLYDDFPHDADALSTHVFDFGGRRYAFETAPTAAYLSSHRAWQSWAVLAVGIFGSAMLGAFLLLSTGYTDRIEREVKERTDEVRRSEFLYHQMFETNAAIKLVMDPESGRILDANQAAVEFYGYPKSDLLSIGIDAINILPLNQIFAKTSLARTEKHLFNCRHRLSSGEIRDVEVYSGPVDLDGKKVVYSIVHDITDRKKTEESLRLFTSIYEASSEAVMVVDRHNLIKTVNPAFTEITGYTLDEVKEQDPKVLSSGRHDEAFYREMWRSLEIYGHWQGEIWDKRKNGEIFPEWLTINTIYDESGDVRERVALFSDISKRKAAEIQVWRQANFDELTGLPNRNMFRDRLEFEIRKSSRTGHAFALLFIDLDRFKEVNDTLGHETGDKLLMEAARRIASSVRESDTVARLGGDEFTVILSDLQGDTHVEKIANTIIQKLALPFNLDDEHAYVSGSIGITLYPDDAKESSELLKHADQAMYEAKNKGRNRFS
ncbi:MAG TPA: diguanylate cyclase, partial [Burkholderiales bacterium]|nr:diguanylate cyclase [Burkholderiales bacterium]